MLERFSVFSRLSTSENKIMKKTILAVLLAGGMVFSVAGCNTFAGAGQDVQRGGEAVEDAARDTQRRM